MSSFELKCKNCGSELTKVSDTVYVCEHCGAQFENKQDIIQNIENKNITQNITKNIVGGALDYEELVKNGDTFFALSEWDKAEESYLKAIDLAPNNCWSWFNMVKLLTVNFKLPFAKDYEQYYEKAMIVASEEEKAEIFKTMQDYYVYVKGYVYSYNFKYPSLNFMDKKLLKRKPKKLYNQKQIQRRSVATIILGIILILIGFGFGIYYMVSFDDLLIGGVIIIAVGIVGLAVMFFGIRLNTVLEKRNYKIFTKAREKIFDVK